MEITLATTRVKDNHHVTITFPNEDAALVWVEEHKSTHAVSQDHDRPVPDEAERILGVLYPKCDHGLSAHLCADPINHYPSDF